MKKIRWAPTPKNSHLVVWVDEEEWKTIHTAVWGHKPHLPQECLTISLFEEQFYALEYQATKQYVLRKLAVRGYFTQELEQTLRKLLVSAPTISRVIEEMTQKGYLDDQLHGAQWIKSQATKKWGPHMIAQKLKAKGVVIEGLPDLFESLYGLDERKKQIQRLLAKQALKRDLSDYSQRQKAIASLVRKGFSPAEILHVLEADFIQ
ncbi:RecX family transcriptional regulator [Parachlamydia sp. AcF125]|uniref:regulatory protein RecX n=1 Tax=Parachlamydia sp. AcF125 TaxID=2795736 RepID=UPI001BC9E0B0|nr:RecX family transcriptional regulator [Parachlamydia sp. AcF125]MBS4168909.1 Regulatory protein RecX [Parachlamydia sp. AcF125]